MYTTLTSEKKNQVLVLIIIFNTDISEGTD